MCRPSSSTVPSGRSVTLGNPPTTFKNRSDFASPPGKPVGEQYRQSATYANDGLGKPKAHQGHAPPKFEVLFNPSITNSAGCLRACRDAIFESSPKANIDFVSVNGSELANYASHIVITCVELDSISLEQNGISPCEIIRMEQRLMNSDNSTWCLAFRGLVALKTASRLTKLRQTQLCKLRSPDSITDNIYHYNSAIPPAKHPTHAPLELQPKPAPKKDPVKTVYKARKNPIFGFSSDDLHNSYTRQVDKLYKHYCPSKRQSVPALMQQYRGREEYLLCKVKAKYCSKPATTRSMYV